LIIIFSSPSVAGNPRSYYEVCQHLKPQKLFWIESYEDVSGFFFALPVGNSTLRLNYRRFYTK